MKELNILRPIIKLCSFSYRVLAWCNDMGTYSQYRKRYTVHKSFRFRGTGIILYGDGNIIAGANSYITRFGVLEAHEGLKIYIGNNCAIGPYVKVYTHDNLADQDFNVVASKLLKKTGDVIIGNGVWIGANVSVMPGCKIGENSVIGAHSVVTRDIPSHSIAVGCPARVIKFKSYLSQEEKLELAKSHWNILSDRLKLEYQTLHL